MRGADFKLLLFQDYGTSITDGRETVGRSEAGGSKLESNVQLLILLNKDA